MQRRLLLVCVLVLSLALLWAGIPLVSADNSSPTNENNTPNPTATTPTTEVTATPTTTALATATATKSAPKPTATKSAPKPTATKSAPKPPAVKAAPKATATKAAPKPTATKPAAKPSKPAPAKGKPAPAKGKPAPAKGKPAPAKGKAAPAKGKKAPAKGRPAPSRGRPAPRRPTPKPAVVIPPGWPRLLSIPKIRQVKLTVESLNFNTAADFHAPYKWDDVAWYDRGPKPGDQGRAIVFGHLDSYCCPAAFWLLRDLKAGDIAQVTYKNGKTLTFRVLWQGIYWNTKLPMNFLFANTKERGLILMTCAGAFHRDGSGYDHKLIVYARLVLPNGRLG